MTCPGRLGWVSVILFVFSVCVCATPGIVSRVSEVTYAILPELLWITVLFCADLPAEHYSWAARAMSFLDKWEDIWCVVEEKYNTLLNERPAKQEKATGRPYGDKVYELLLTKKEVRNVACNLAWTHPVENTNLQCNISMATVERFALDMYVDTTAAHGQAAGSAAGSAGEGEGEGDGGGQRAAMAWKIPPRVPRGYEIQIAIVTAATEPSWGLTLLLMPLAMKWGRRGSLQSDSSVSSRIIGEPLRLQKGRQRRRQRRRRSCMKHIINQLCLDSLSSCSCFRNLEHIFEY